MFPEFIENLIQKVEGKNSTQDVTVFTLSTCMWCKKCKQYLKDRDIQYKFIIFETFPSPKPQPCFTGPLISYDFSLSFGSLTNPLLGAGQA